MLQIQTQNNCDFDGIHKISLNNINFNKRGAVLIKDNSLRSKNKYEKEAPFMLS